VAEIIRESPAKYLRDRKAANISPPLVPYKVRARERLDKRFLGTAKKGNIRKKKFAMAHKRA